MSHPNAKLLGERMAVLGVTTADAERTDAGLTETLQRSCAGCSDKTMCKRDLALRPDDPLWTVYCPNGVTLEALARATRDTSLRSRS